MSRFYTNVVQTKSKIIHYYIEDGKRKVERVNFKPSLGITTKKSEGITDIYGNNIGLMKFESFGEFHNWKKENGDYIDIYNDIQPKYQFIAEKYPQKIKPEFDKVRVDIWDLECNPIDGDESQGFPNPTDALLPITAITIMDYYENEFFVFGFKEDYIPESDNIVYFHCEDEWDLLTKFLSLVKKRRPDIISGWNIEGFDIPYIINRMKIILAKDEFLKLSPLHDIRQVKLENDATGYKIIGIAIIDYLKLYKKLSIKKSENYKLDTILEKEIKRNKVQFHDEYSSLTDLYNRNFKKFIDYNIYDCQGIGELNDQIRFFEVLMMMAYDSKASFEDVFGTVGIWDVNLYNLFLKYNIVHSPKKIHHRESFPGGYVKEPIPGFYKNVSVADITSSYPNQIISGNMSPETLVPYDKLSPRLKDLSLKVKRLDWKNDPEAYLDFELINAHTEEMIKHNVCMMANGEFFKTDKEGLFPKIVSEIFQRRKKRKKEAGEYKVLLNNLKRELKKRNIKV